MSLSKSQKALLTLLFKSLQAGAKPSAGQLRRDLGWSAENLDRVVAELGRRGLLASATRLTLPGLAIAAAISGCRSQRVARAA